MFRLSVGLDLVQKDKVELSVRIEQFDLPHGQQLHPPAIILEKMADLRLFKYHWTQRSRWYERMALTSRAV